MSTILDALRKSEQERKLNNIPTLSDIPAPEERSSYMRVWFICGLVIILLLLIILVTLMGNRFVVPNQLANESAQAISKLEGQGGEGEVVTPKKSIDDFQVNVVSWSESEEQRFVIIDGKLVRQGELATPDLKVVEIKLESVILEYKGKRVERHP